MWNKIKSPDFKDSSKPSSGIKDAFAFIWELIKVVIISLAIILPIRYFLVQPFYVKGASMEPNFYDRDYLIVDEISYRLRSPERGEVVIFRYPRDRSQYFIKRIIGLPGEDIIIKNGQVIINGSDGKKKELIEPYVTLSVATSGNIDVSLGSTEYFLLGDNRDASLDSRSFGAVKSSDFIGRAWIRGWPFNRWDYFSSPPTVTTLQIEL
ncbi:MAG: signal peptidase I [Patescibacteria group bacterium]